MNPEEVKILTTKIRKQAKSNETTNMKTEKQSMAGISA